ncbi:DUF805 domain-containing protein [Herbiconiux sp. 11R-BC]|uniref:DUF805 domain-containing protein n=1 Tax=Herbiconiux sp. 11R-BC TaxID=3111637 RepID=UPI003BFC09AF
MTFGESISTVLRKYADFAGVASRSEFWWWILFTALVSAALNVFTAVPISGGSSVGALLSGVWSVAVLVPNLAVGVRRLRDAGHSWPNLFWVLVPIGGLVVLIVYFTQPSRQPVPGGPEAIRV